MAVKKGEEVLEKIELLAKTGFLPIIGRKKGAFLEKLVKKKKPKQCLEIGTLLGYSAIMIARNLGKGSLTTIEINPLFAKHTRENIETAGLSKNVIVKTGDAAKVVKRLRGKFDFVFIDAAKEEYITYLKVLEKKMKKGCVVAADNTKIFAAYMGDYLDYVRESGKYKSKSHDFGFDAMEVSVKK